MVALFIRPPRGLGSAPPCIKKQWEVQSLHCLFVRHEASEARRRVVVVHGRVVLGRVDELLLYLAVGPLD